MLTRGFGVPQFCVRCGEGESDLERNAEDTFNGGMQGVGGDDLYVTRNSIMANNPQRTRSSGDCGETPYWQQAPGMA